MLKKDIAFKVVLTRQYFLFINYSIYMEQFLFLLPGGPEINSINFDSLH